jgi:hypothetical protein
MDYAFAPGVTQYDAAAQQLFTNRPNTRLIQARGLTALADFFSQLDTATGIQLPAGDLFVTSHGSDVVSMLLHLVSTQTDATTYEVVEAAATSGAARIPTSVNHDSGGTLTSMSANFRGCWFGLSPPYVDKLKEALGNESPVTAPKGAHEFIPIGTTGMIEFLLSIFRVVAKDPLADQAAVAATLASHTPAFTFRDGSSVAAALWTAWVPKDISTGKRVSQYVYARLGRKLGTQTRRRVEIWFSHYEPWLTANVPGLTGLPSDDPARIAALRNQLHAAANVPGSPWASTHPLPMYQRFAHSSIDEFVDGMNWAFTWDASTSMMGCTGSQHEYSLHVPITDPPDLSTGKLIYNFYPSPGSSDAAVNELLTSDNTLFYTA